LIKQFTFILRKPTSHLRPKPRALLHFRQKRRQLSLASAQIGDDPSQQGDNKLLVTTCEGLGGKISAVGQLIGAVVRRVE
jgi:hypothetical protein